jgi:hypothetical protein
MVRTFVLVSSMITAVRRFRRGLRGAQAGRNSRP